ncbi:hypothetical protein PIB30_080095 [Stylosanthes scabra]|uniref:Uncharacterized protein n=1 Tax=Stylosanthes scabra TaxID=79078 RepID=A0ABU6QRK0_9FABA|nr:hypothetical protein [Stylosanthes scabra]
MNKRIRRDALDSEDSQEQVAEEQEEQTPPLDDFDSSANSSVNGPSQGLGNELQANATSADASGASAGKKRKHMDILEKMVEIVHLSIKAQEKNAQILADAIYGVNDRFKLGEKLESLGFCDDEVVQVVLKISENPNLCSVFWGLTDTQQSLFIRTILGSN